jgi:pimeloyl-ACP methyl ester carboxylesterase
MSRRSLATFVAFAVALGTAGVLVTVAPASARATAATSSPALDWTACGSHLQCATLSVPVDYSQPDGEQVKLAVARHRATDTSHRLGSLVFNFGGPGDAGTQTLPDFVSAIPAEIKARYDLVSFDPRGVGRSKPITCIDDKTNDLLAAEDPTPNSDADLRAFYDGTNEVVDLVAACVARNGAWLGQVGSRDVARDMDRLRAALGDDQLNYLGYSYGTVIGAVYAQMFPQRVGRLVLDSPVNLSSTALEELHADANGFETALDEFLADCAAHSRCTFHSAGDPVAAFRELQQRFEGGLTLKTTTATGKRGSRVAGVGAFYTAVLSALYDKQFGWPELAQALEDAKTGDGTLLLELADSYNGRHDDGTYDNIDQVIGAILCDDRYDPMPSFEEYTAEYHDEVAEYPLLGSFVGSSTLGCDPRLPKPPESEQLGDVRASGTRPILVVGTTKDPATPFAGAQDLTTRLVGSRLLTFRSTEHTAYTKSPCIDAAVDTYLLDGKLPPVGKTCAS